MNFELTVADYIEYFHSVAKKIAEEKEYITELDARTGDGDHWVNLNKGFTAIIDRSKDWNNMSLSEMFKQVGMLLMSKVGGSSGALYGSAYLNAAKISKDYSLLDKDSLLRVLEAQLEAIMHHGKAEPGFKTMIDPLYQAIEVYRNELEEQHDVETSINAFRQGAETGMKATREMKAVKGRATYQSDKGVGQLDPGAVTMYYQLNILADLCIKKIIN